jgi:hypothetical protein
MNCENCGRELTPCPAKLRADGEQTYVGFIPCACDKRIMTDFGVVEPGTEEHEMLIRTGNYGINDILV